MIVVTNNVRGRSTQMFKWYSFSEKSVFVEPVIIKNSVSYNFLSFQLKDARAALDALREEEKERLRREAEEAERIRQIQVRDSQCRT